MPAAFQLQVATPERVVLTDEITSLVVPAAEGYLGVMARHAPLVAELRVGEMRVRRAGGRQAFYAISGGIMEVSGEGVLVLADGAEAPEEIDVRRAEAALERARRRLSPHIETDEEQLDVDRARAAITRAGNRLRVAHRHGGP